MKKESDQILWCPPAAANAATHLDRPMMIHRCPMAVLPHWTSRGGLDPMALDECRYCKGNLP